MLFLTQSAAVYGIDAIIVDIEVNLQPVAKENESVPPFTIVGLPDTAIRESRERIRAAITNSGYFFPFHKTTVNLGVDQSVTAFTASDFGRTLTSNGDGSDHGWGNHHFIVGGAVKGKAFYGKAPGMGVGNTGGPQDQDHVGQGRLLPTTSVDQYAATLAKWFGVADSEMGGVLPNLGSFGGAAYPTNLGFMA